MLYDEFNSHKNFAGGEPFAPDFVLFLKEKKTKQEIVYQVFIEPKNEMLAKAEPWKEEFLLAIEKKYTILKLLKWKIKILNYWGYHFLMTWES